MACRILLVRHCSTGREYSGRYIGSSDIEADAAALDNIHALTDQIASYAPEHCFHSSMMRARQTAEKINRRLSLILTEDKNLCEIDFGRWEKCSFQEISEKDPDLVKQWAKGNADFTFPQGEEISLFRRRVQKIGNQIAKSTEKTVLVVTHGGVIRTMICQLLGLSPDNYLIFDIKPASLAVVEMWNGKGILTGLNLGTGE